MLKKTTLLLLIVFTAGFTQNLQIHYEASEDREYFVSTLEMFKPDNYGSTFWFVDMEYSAPGNIKAASLAYWEIARSFTLPIENLSATIQYNDGVANFGNLGQAWLMGVSYYLDLGFVALPVDILYRSVQGSGAHDFQVTTAWYIPLLDNNLEFSGFMDIWSQDKALTSEKEWVLLTEPQLWYNANDHFSIGSEVEISKNFIFGESELQALPTLGLRWTF